MPTRTCPAILLLLALWTTAATLSGQESNAPGFGTIAGAVLGGAVGFAVGGLAGAAMTSSGCESGNPDACLGEAFPGFIWGAGAGITLGVPGGAHLLNGRRGDLGRSTLVSVGLFAAEVLALSLLVDDGRTENGDAVRAVAIGVPVLQIISSVLIESRTDGR